MESKTGNKNGNKKDVKKKREAPDEVQQLLLMEDARRRTADAPDQLNEPLDLEHGM